MIIKKSKEEIKENEKEINALAKKLEEMCKDKNTATMMLALRNVRAKIRQLNRDLEALGYEETRLNSMIQFKHDLHGMDMMHIDILRHDDLWLEELRKTVFKERSDVPLKETILKEEKIYNKRMNKGSRT